MTNFNIRNVHEWPLAIRGGMVALAFLITLFLGYQFDLTSLREKLNMSVQQEGDLKLQYELLIRKKVSLKHAISSLPVLRAQLADWQKSIIKHEDLAELLNTILKLAANNHLYVSLFDPDVAVQEGEYEKLPIKMVLVGSYHQLSDFLSQLANLPQLVVIGDFLISNENKNDVLGAKLAQQANQQGLLTVEMKLGVYYQPEPVLEENKPVADNAEAVANER